MEIVQIGDIGGIVNPGLLQTVYDHIGSIQPDLVVFTGNGTPSEQDSWYGELARIITRSGRDTLLTPGPGDDRGTYEVFFGRRYRIDPPQRHLDRFVRIGGVPALLIDSADGVLDENQLLWFESHLYDLTREAARGAIGSNLLVFSHFPLIPEGDHIENAYQVIELLSAVSESQRNLNITLLSGNGELPGVSSIPGGQTFGCPPMWMSRNGDKSHEGPQFRVIRIDPRGVIQSKVITAAGNLDRP